MPDDKTSNRHTRREMKVPGEERRVSSEWTGAAVRRAKWCGVECNQDLFVGLTKLCVVRGLFQHSSVLVSICVGLCCVPLFLVLCVCCVCYVSYMWVFCVSLFFMCVLCVMCVLYVCYVRVMCVACVLCVLYVLYVCCTCVMCVVYVLRVCYVWYVCVMCAIICFFMRMLCVLRVCDRKIVSGKVEEFNGDELLVHDTTLM